MVGRLESNSFYKSGQELIVYVKEKSASMHEVIAHMSDHRNFTTLRSRTGQIMLALLILAYMGIFLGSFIATSPTLHTLFVVLKYSIPAFYGAFLGGDYHLTNSHGKFASFIRGFFQRLRGEDTGPQA